VPTVVKKDTEKMNVPNGPGTPRSSPPQTRRVLKESISLLRRSSSWEEDVTGPATFEDCAED
jgi:hypothetical protein